MTDLGVSCLAHDAAVAAVDDTGVVFAAHSERYSRRKNDRLLNGAILADAFEHAGRFEAITYYERPWLKKTRQLRAAQLRSAASISPRQYLRTFPSLAGLPVGVVGHHESHAAGAYFTSPFRDAAVVVVDAIGEWETLTVWHAVDRELRRVLSVRYPHSIGLLYSAFTDRIGLKPNEEEYILMGMAAYGEPRYRDLIARELVGDTRGWNFRLRRSVHRGLRDWHPELTNDLDIAASVQALVEEVLLGLFRWVRANVPSRNVAYAGGVALNCVFNAKLAETGWFDRIWVPPNPGDAGSAVGAVLARRRDFVEWRDAFVGHDVRRPIDPAAVAAALAGGAVVGVANGRAEYGPRALGNRSLLADPRGSDVKDRVNEIKKRQRFRPFAPAVLADRAADLFEMPVPEAPYMQYVVRCRRPDLYPAICHVDGTSRVQTVKPGDRTRLHEILVEFERLTGCPMLLNTSLNVRGEPLVNTWQDALRFSRHYRVPVF